MAILSGAEDFFFDNDEDGKSMLRVSNMPFHYSCNQLHCAQPLLYQRFEHPVILNNHERQNTLTRQTHVKIIT